jgi:4-diphosphocytidyl-2-C-methyl-D-erythritol kinase
LTLALPARAKLNLDLEVLDRQDDGFHRIRTRLQAIDLHDLVLMTPADETTLTTSGLPFAGASDSSVIKAHRAVEEAAGLHLPTRFHLHKRIPPGAGLGGASSDAAAVLRGLVTMNLLTVDVAEIAGRLGADVPFFIAGGAAVAEGRGELLTPAEVEPAWFALAWPGIELPTAAVYRAWDEVKTDSQDINHLARAAAHVEPRIREFAARLGGGWQLTGSGSAFFKRCDDFAEARRVTAGMDCWTGVTHPVGRWA